MIVLRQLVERRARGAVVVERAAQGCVIGRPAERGEEGGGRVLHRAHQPDLDARAPPDLLAAELHLNDPGVAQFRARARTPGAGDDEDRHAA
ncbi:MAG TPA: hypothetical protein VGD56_08835 [Gemmatirosa sp.]